ncbi:hypothetical protein SBBP1_50007 [Burkholderiales bacterium]|nr:hypothetical protein SBBP1_50007 [Burkholderiales bacterium]
MGPVPFRTGAPPWHRVEVRPHARRVLRPEMPREAPVSLRPSNSQGIGARDRLGLNRGPRPAGSPLASGASTR